ncbi:class I SAM-dependent methyltransferase [Aquabacterium sp.]|uniref:class I SAM-dependent methyltransferase n=1 Tax=Aquabacterium sp. TaxID=1872578 RepID=UPI003783DE38
MNPVAPTDAGGFDKGYADEQIRRSRHPLRRFIKGFYLRSVMAHIDGPTIDYGCGAGQLLARLPAGSVGLELNPHLIAALTARGQSARQWRADDEGFDLPGLEPGLYRNLVISHVLEHLPDPTASLKRLLRACRRIGVRRLIAIVPGAKGYASDATHRSFIDSRYVAEHGWQSLEGFRLASRRFFPMPWEVGGQWFVYNEMQLVFELAAEPGAAR